MEGEQEHSQVSMEASMTLDDDDVSETSFSFGGSGSADANNVGWTAASLFMERPPAPFVLKTYDIVNDHKTNAIISWNTTGTSLIVWDAHRFVAEVMQKYFRHNNFSSFVCQLNTYGFKKISWDRWEYQNEWFQKGKMSWLKNIKRTGNSRVVQQAKGAEPIAEMTMLGTDCKLQKLNNEYKVLNGEIMMLKKQLEGAEKELDTIKTEMQISKSKQHKLVMIVAQAFLKERKELNSIEVAKKPRLIEQERTESLVEPDDSRRTPSENVDKFSEIQDISCSDNCPIKEKEDDAKADSSHSAFDNEKYEQLGKLLMNYLNIKNVPGEKMANHQSTTVIELEDLLGEQVDWAEYVKELGDKASCLKSKHRY